MLTISPELQHKLEQVAQTDGLTADELAEGVLSYYLDIWRDEYIWEPDEEAAVLEAIAESKKPDAQWYTTEEVMQHLAERRARRMSKPAKSDG